MLPFHPAVAAWFARRFGSPTEPQARAWPAIRARRHALIAAPTGSGKTLAAFLAVLDDLVREGLDGPLPDETRVVYVSPLKALSNDIQRNLEEPLGEIRAELRRSGLPDVDVRTLVRTGDTAARDRLAMRRRPPHVLVTTPESLYILLTSEGGRGMLRTARTVIVDEIHAVAGDKRGSHLALSLERLAALIAETGPPPVRIGLSATQRPIEEIARFLVGTGPEGGSEPDCEIVDLGHRRALDLAVELPASPLEAVMSAEVWKELYDRLAERIREHATTLVFVNTRRLAERVARHLSERLGEEHVTAHHGSLSRAQRFDAEQRLKAGRLRALVATASLELGIDIGSVDLVCSVGSTRSIATLLQRVGRSGHRIGAVPRGRVFPTSRDELVECAALLEAVRRGDLERLRLPAKPLDILAQQIVAEVAARPWDEEGLFRLVRRAYPYRDLAREEFDEVVRMLAEGFGTRVGRRAAWIHHDAVNGRLRARRGARLAAITSGGAIPDTADYPVVLEPSGALIGSVNEDFAIESIPGDVFQLGNTSWRIRRIDRGRVLVEDARGQPPTLPFWLGEAPARSAAASAAVMRFRRLVDGALARSREEAARDVVDATGIDAAAAEQILDYLEPARAALGALPDGTTIVLERFFDEAGNQHVVLHSPHGGRINRAWGLALRKRFCRKFNFELQAAANEDAIVLSLGPTHSFRADEVFSFLHSSSVREVLVQALLDAPMFTARWRWNASRALAVLRWRSGRKVPPRLQRMQAEDLISLVFPDQLACLENIGGEREVPDHPLVRQTIGDCLDEAMDVGGLEALLRRIEAGEVRCVARDLREPSPLAHEVLNAKPYAFLDDAPLEERRTQAVHQRRWLDAESAADLGRLDAEAIERARAEAWPGPNGPDEVHDALFTLGFATAGESRAWAEHLDALAADRRATRLHESGGPVLWVAVERLPELRAVLPGAEIAPQLEVPRRFEREWTSSEALVELLRGRLSGLGPVTVRSLAEAAGFERGAVVAALAVLESEGHVMRGRFTPGSAAGEEEWCERGLLARIHRATLDRLRREIEPVSQADYLRFLLGWQRAAPGRHAEGPEGLAAVLEQLDGFEAPAAAWESEILPARIENYDPVWLDALCLSGRFVWRRVVPPAGGRSAGPVSTTPIALLRRAGAACWVAPPATEAEVAEPALSYEARSVESFLRERGASFFADVVAGSGLLRTQVENALGELVARGRATSDAFTGLRALLVPSSRRPDAVGGRRRSRAVFGMESAGRWSLLPPVEPSAPPGRDQEALSEIARALLRRYGVVFRAVVEREGLLPPWRELLRAFRRLEARGEIRGGRFVDGFTGEQYALPDAVGSLRSIRRTGGDGTLVSVSAADPLNLIGIAVPGDRVPIHPRNRVLYRDGVPIAIRESRETRFLVELPPSEEWQARNALLRRRTPPQLRAYLGRPA